MRPHIIGICALTGQPGLGSGCNAIPLSPGASCPSKRHPAQGWRALKVRGLSFAAAPFWRPEINPFVLSVEARPVSQGYEDGFDVADFKALLHVERCRKGHEHVLFWDGSRHLQLMVLKGTVVDGPVLFHYRLNGFRHLEAKTLTLRRLTRLRRLRRFPKSLYPMERRAQRWVMMLRAWDGVCAGASQRAIASALYGEKLVQEDWHVGFLRTRVQRLVRSASALVHGGYRDLMREP